MVPFPSISLKAMPSMVNLGTTTSGAAVTLAAQEPQSVSGAGMEVSVDLCHTAQDCGRLIGLAFSHGIDAYEIN